jgi:hypothetical protein
MELLMLIGLAVKGVVYAGYGLTGIYLTKTGIQYVKDYKEYNERG